MSKLVHINSTAEFSSLLASSHIVVVDFYADWCGPCKAIAPMYEQLSSQLSRPNRITFTKVDTDKQQELARAYGVTAMPTFMIFKNQRRIDTIRGADNKRLSEAVRKLAIEAESASTSNGAAEGSGSGSAWLGAGLPKGYRDITDQVDLLNLELLNLDTDFGTARKLFDSSKPTSEYNTQRGNVSTDYGAAEDVTSDYVLSDTDEQLMLYVPFQSTLKIHTLHITSTPPEDEEDSESPARPSTIKVYTNRSHILGFEEADDAVPTQEISLSKKDWDTKTNTAKAELRFVKFQNVTSLVVFIARAEGGAEKTRIDRIRIIGETGEKRDLGKLEKIGDDD